MWKLHLMLGLLAVLCTAPRSHQFKISATNEVNPVDVIAKRSVPDDPGCDGCPRELDPTQPSTIHLVYEIVDLIHDGQVYKVVKIKRATEQIVAGLMYNVDVVLSICDTAWECYIALCDLEAHIPPDSEELTLSQKYCVPSNRP